MSEETKIKAMKGNLEGEFSEMVWDIGNLERHGWREVGVRSKVVEVESEKIPIVEVEPVDDPIKPKINKPKELDNDDSLYPTDDEIRSALKEKGVEFHHALGTKKLRRLYEDSK